MTNFNYIDDQETLEFCCKILKTSINLAVDTEFVRERTFFPLPGLIQVSDGKTISLIDPNANIDLSCFFSLLESPDIRIIMHSASEDVELFNAMGCGTIQNLFDTQIAAAWIGLGQSLSLQKLVEQYQNVVIEKQHSRTNWLKRPLSDAQLEYAAIDVLYLIPILELQLEILEGKNFLQAVIEDCDLRCEQKPLEHNDDKAYLKIKKGKTTQTRSLERLKLLAKWRELQARKDDKPRQHIIKDAEVLLISFQAPTTSEQLTKTCGLSSYEAKRYGKLILALIQDEESNSNTGQASSISVQPVLSLRSLPAAGETLKALRALMLDINKQQNIPLEVLPSKRWLEGFLLHLVADWYPKPEGWNGWRKALLEKSFQQIIKEYKFNRMTNIQ